jgi:hypothetical protein
VKVVINACFGGFGLSAAGVIKFNELKGRTVAFFESVKGRNYDTRGYVRVPNDEAAAANPRQLGFIYTLLGVPDDVNDLSLKAFEKFEYFSDHDIERHDPDLVKVVEELGDRADGTCAKLRVVDVPDGIEYEVEEYDGNEHIAERHRTWS